MVPFYGWGSNVSKILSHNEEGDSSLFTFRSPGVSSTHFIKLKRMKAEPILEPLTGFETWTR